MLGGGAQPAANHTGSEARRSGQSNTAGEGTPEESPTVAYVNSRPVTVADLEPGLFEAAGGEVLADWIVQREVERRLARRGLSVGPDDVERERTVLAQYLSETVDVDAPRVDAVLQALRQRLGPRRFDRLLTRNAGLRTLIDQDIAVSDAAVRQRYEVLYGPKYEARLIVVSSLRAANDIARDAEAGASFIDMAVELSEDVSSARGGLLPPISLADATYPQALRQALRSLDVGGVSPPVDLGGQFAVLKLEGKVEARDVPFEQVEPALEAWVRLEAQRLRMQQLTQSILAETDVVIFDDALEWSWRRRAVE